MSSAPAAALALTLLAAAALYARGWWRLSRLTSPPLGLARLVAFQGGLATVALALASPLHALAGQRLSAHMVQHLLLMLVGPPLLWLGAPLGPLPLGLPRTVRRWGPAILAARPVERLGRALDRPLVAWVAFTVAFWTWHLPAPYDLALRSHPWHHAEHACFLAAGLLFWRPVVAPWPARPGWPRWTIIPYLLVADVQNAALGAILTFSDRVIYPAYLPGVKGGLTPLEDQALAGVIMWVPGSLVFLLAVACVTIEVLAPRGRAPAGTAGAGPAVRARAILGEGMRSP